MNLVLLSLAQSGQILFGEKLVIEWGIPEGLEDGVLFGIPEVLYEAQGRVDPLARVDYRPGRVRVLSRS